MPGRVASTARAPCWRAVTPYARRSSLHVHRRIDDTGRLTPGQAAALLRWNGVRLGVATTSLAAVATLAAGQLAGTA